MAKKNLKKTVALILGLGIAVALSLTAGPKKVMASELESQQGFSVNFSEEYPVIGEALRIEVDGLEENETCTYLWKVDNKEVSRGESYTPVSEDLEKFITVNVTTSGGRSLEQSIYFSKLPVVYIDTNNVPILDKENYVKGSMFIQGNNKFNLTNSTLYDGDLEIRGRGNSSWEAPKKPYRLKLGSKADIFGMGASKHWTLLANYYDASLSRNKLSYDFSGELGLVYMDSENVILIMNGQYQGVYQLCEHIRIDKTRINITDWEKIAEDVAEVISEAEGIDAGDLEDYLVENMAWITSKKIEFEGKTYNLADYEIELPGIDGGYLLELDKNLDEVSSFYSSHNQPLMFKSPEYVKTNKEMLQYVKDYVNAFEAAIDAEDGYTMYNGKEVHYSELYDMDALVQYFLVTELFFNTDGMKKSTYLYKDSDDLMKMGPIWDMDWCAGNPYEQSSPWNKWETLFYDDEMVSEQWYRSLIGDPYFAYRVKELYDAHRTAIESFVLEGGRIDKNVEYLKEAGIKNDAKWNSKSTGFSQNTENLKKWLSQRIDWMDEQMESVDSLLESWETFQSNQENGSVISIGDVAATEKGLKVNIGTNGSEKVGVYINGIKYEELVAENKQLEALIPYENLKDVEGTKAFITVRTMYQGKVCTAYKGVELPEVTPEPEPDPEPEPETDVTKVFKDLEEGAWYVADIQYVYDKELMTGSNGLFKPVDEVSRAQFVTTLYRLAGSPKIEDDSACKEFPDVSEGEYYTAPVCWAYANGITTGSNGVFNTNGKLSRQQLATFLYRFAEYMECDVTAEGDYSGLLNADQVDEYAEKAMKWAVGSGIISGSGKTDAAGNKVYDLNPKGNTTRAQLAAILRRFSESNHF